LAICWEKLHIIIVTLSAGNLVDLYLLRILRDYTPKSVCCLLIPHVRSYSDISCDKYDTKFRTYLAGLIEGDGTIVVPKTERSAKGVLNYPSIQIVFDLRDLPLALVIQLKLGHGSISRKKGINAYVLTINSFEGITLVVRLINGYMRTPKINALYRLIDFLNKRFSINIEKRPEDTSSINSNS
jgi:hypothetical protein